MIEKEKTTKYVVDGVKFNTLEEAIDYDNFNPSFNLLNQVGQQIDDNWLNCKWSPEQAKAQVYFYLKRSLSIIKPLMEYYYDRT